MLKTLTLFQKLLTIILKPTIYFERPQLCKSINNMIHWLQRVGNYASLGLGYIYGPDWSQGWNKGRDAAEPWYPYFKHQGILKVNP